MEGDGDSLFMLSKEDGVDVVSIGAGAVGATDAGDSILTGVVISGLEK